MSKEEKIENIKNVSEFYQALRNEIANIFNSYERCGIFDGWTENQKKECFGFGTYILSNVWLPIQKHYTNKERKKYQKIENKYEDICKRQDQQIAELQKQLAEKDKEIEFANKQVLEAENQLEKQASIHYKHLKEVVLKIDQDKISFAVNQLEKVKGLIANHTQELWTCENDDIDVVLYEEIDNQINELKGKVEDVKD